MTLVQERAQGLYGTCAGFVLRRSGEGMTEAVLTLPAFPVPELAT
jgi:hypothetical protein